MGMKDQNFRFISLPTDLHISSKQIIHIELFRPDHRRTVYRIKIAQKVLKISQFINRLVCRYLG